MTLQNENVNQLFINAEISINMLDNLFIVKTFQAFDTLVGARNKKQEVKSRFQVRFTVFRFCN